MASAVDRLVPGFMDSLSKELSAGLQEKIIVDLGCGFGIWGHILRSWSHIGGSEAYMIGCDVSLKILQKTKKYNPYDEMIICDIKFLPFREKYVDIIIALEVVEHLNKNEGMKFLISLSTLAREKIVISTPYGLYKQHDTYEYQFEEHKSFWTEKDFTKAGYNVNKYGIGLNLEVFFKKIIY